MAYKEDVMARKFADSARNDTFRELFDKILHGLHEWRRGLYHEIKRMKRLVNIERQMAMKSLPRNVERHRRSRRVINN